MPDEGLTAAVATETPAGSSQPTPADGASEQAAETTQTAQPDPYALPADVDVDEFIRRNPRFQGKIGSLAQQQATRQFQDWQRQQQATRDTEMEQARREELRQLARNDPDKLAQETLRDLRSQETKAREMELWQEFQKQTGGQLEAQLDKALNTPTAKAIWATADEATRQRMDWRNYNEIADWQDYMSDLLAEHKSGPKAEAKAKALVEAASKSTRVEEMAGEASEGVDLGLGGLVTGGRQFRRSEINPHSPNFMGREAYKKHAAAIEYQADNGLLIED